MTNNTANDQSQGDVSELHQFVWPLSLAVSCEVCKDTGCQQ